VLKHLQGAYSMLFLFPNESKPPRSLGHPAARARQDAGRPLVRGERDVRVRRDRRRVRPRDRARRDRPHRRVRRSQPLLRRPAPEKAHCVFEHVYFANPASKIFGQNVHLAREQMGRQLAREAPVAGRLRHADARQRPLAALGFAKESGIAFEEGIVPNRFVGRTFILPARPRATAPWR
jgi:amidophosphoribosyltransferase